MSSRFSRDTPYTVKKIFVVMFIGLLSEQDVASKRLKPLAWQAHRLRLSGG
jgi:hypothetical protein